MDGSQYVPAQIERLIKLHGDRAGQASDSICSGLVWIQNTKMILVKDSGTSKVHCPGSWRQLSRLVNLAEQLRRPVLLWNVCLGAAKENAGSIALEVADVIQNGRRNLLRFPAPIISIFDDTPCAQLLECELVIADGAVLVDEADKVNQYLSISHRIRSAGCYAEIEAAILGLLTEISAIPVAQMVSERINRLRRIAEHRN